MDLKSRGVGIHGVGIRTIRKIWRVNKPVPN